MTIHELNQMWRKFVLDFLKHNWMCNHVFFFSSWYPKLINSKCQAIVVEVAAVDVDDESKLQQLQVNFINQLRHGNGKFISFQFKFDGDGIDTTF